MPKRLLARTLMLIISLQSVMAVADVHQMHQSGLRHLNFQHHHHNSHDSAYKSLSTVSKSNSNVDIIDVDSKTQLRFDCHHCCHCHGVHHHWMVTSLDIMAPINSVESATPFHIELPNSPPESLLRPPIV